MGTDAVEAVQLLLASHNEGKLQEFRQLLVGVPFEMTSLKAQSVLEDVEETGVTFQENACIKAEAYARLTGLLTLADDSGLEVDALGGAPGVYSARYGGPGLSDEDRVDLLLRNLRSVPWNLRGARFRCVIAIAAPERRTVMVEGVVEGVIQYEPLGNSGFGYDPVFYLPELGLTTAELPMNQKNALSHRGQAARKVQALFKEWATGGSGLGA